MISKWAGGLLTLAILYFAYHAFAGEQGLGRWSDMQAELADKETYLLALRAENDALESDIERLMPGQVDADLVEYLARRELGFVRPDEVILTDTSQRVANMNRR